MKPETIKNIRRDSAMLSRYTNLNEYKRQVNLAIKHDVSIIEVCHALLNIHGGKLS